MTSLDLALSTASAFNLLLCSVAVLAISTSVKCLLYYICYDCYSDNEDL